MTAGSQGQHTHRSNNGLSGFLRMGGTGGSDVQNVSVISRVRPKESLTSTKDTYTKNKMTTKSLLQKQSFEFTSNSVRSECKKVTRGVPNNVLYHITSTTSYVTPKNQVRPETKVV